MENNHKSSLELITFVDQYTINWLSHLKTNTQLTTFKSKTGFDNIIALVLFIGRPLTAGVKCLPQLPTLRSTLSPGL